MRDMYNKIKLTSRRWAWILAVKESALLPKIHHFDILKLFGQLFKGKINIITRELSTIFRAFFGLTYQLSCCIGDKKWKSSWLVLTTQLNHWYIINKIFWKSKAVPQKVSTKKESHSAIWLKKEFHELYR